MTDFVLAGVCPPCAMARHLPLVCATLICDAGWKAPETYGQGKRCARVYPASDVFSLAMVIHQTISRKVPFHGRTVENISLAVSLRFDPTAKSVLRQLSKGKKTLQELQDDWLDDNELNDRRPDVDDVEDGCPKRLPSLMKKCWYEPRPHCRGMMSGRVERTTFLPFFSCAAGWCLLRPSACALTGTRLVFFRCATGRTIRGTGRQVRPPCLSLQPSSRRSRNPAPMQRPGGLQSGRVSSREY